MLTYRNVCSVQCHSKCKRRSPHGSAWITRGLKGINKSAILQSSSVLDLEESISLWYLARIRGLKFQLKVGHKTALVNFKNLWGYVQKLANVLWYNFVQLFSVIKIAMEAKLCLVLMLITLGTLTVQGAIPRNNKNHLEDVMVGTSKCFFDLLLTTVYYYNFF